MQHLVPFELHLSLLEDTSQSKAFSGHNQLTLIADTRVKHYLVLE